MLSLTTKSYEHSKGKEKGLPTPQASQSGLHPAQAPSSQPGATIAAGEETGTPGSVINCVWGSAVLASKVFGSSRIAKVTSRYWRRALQPGEQF